MTLISTFRKMIDADEAQITSASLRTAIERTEAMATETAAKLVELDDRRAKALLSASDGEISKIESALVVARLDLERAEAALSVLRERLEVVQQAEADAARAAERSAIEERAAAAAKRLAERYQPLVEELRDLLRETAEADLAAENFERRHTDEVPIPRVEARARRQPEERRLVGERRIWAWRTADGRLFTETGVRQVRPEKIDDPENRRVPRYRGNGPPVNPDFLSEIEANRASPHATYRLQYGTGAVVTPVRVVERTIQVTPAHAPEPLGMAMALPALRAGGQGYKPPSFAGGPSTVIAALNAPPIGRPVETRVELHELGDEHFNEHEDDADDAAQP